ncbi:MAG: CpaD family pilus assembly protein [Beijerinckiaceae bacterium]|nr:CpaD family pilus assembly protein [Beijerinckiaceae bacterium]
MSSTHTPGRARTNWRRAILVASLAAPALAACAPDRVLTTASIPGDYRARHPIALTQAPITADIVPAGPRLDGAARESTRAFASEYARSGNGPIAIQIPASGGSAQNARAMLDGIRHELAAAGVNGPVSVSTYQPADPALVSPVRLTFVGTKAVVRTRCGEWPRDLASGSTVDGWQNESYWNHGCAYQQAIANQVADPRDLAGPRAETPSDVTMRTRAISKVREGADPGTQWTIENSSIGTVGAN